MPTHLLLEYGKIGNEFQDVKVPHEIGLQPVDNKAVEKIAATEAEKQPSSSCKNGCAEVGNVAPSKVTEKYKSNKYNEVNYCYGEGESL